jgi:hypothetical protein
MAFAIFLDVNDLNRLSAISQDVRITGKLRTDGRAFWTGGLSAWQSAPTWPQEYPGYPSDPTGKMITVTGTTLQSFRDWLYAVAAANPNFADYLRKLSDFFADRWGAVEPWPFTPGIDPWEGYVRQPPRPVTTTTVPPPLPVTSTTPLP